MATAMAKTRRGTIRKTQPHADMYKGLADMLAEVAPQVNEAVRKQALQQLRAAIDGFREEYPYVAEGDASKRRANVSKNRKALKVLSAALADCSDNLRKLPPEPLAQLLRNRNGRPIGRFAKALAEWAQAARQTYFQCKTTALQPANDALAYLAYAVASVLQDTLEKKVSLSRDVADHRKPRVGAAFERLLREVLNIAGVDAAKDVFPLMLKGKALLEEHGAR